VQQQVSQPEQAQRDAQEQRMDVLEKGQQAS